MEKKEFNKFQSIFWPIHRHELKKFLPMSILMMFMLLAYTMVRDLKESFFQCRAHLWIGAEDAVRANLMGTVRFWFVLPSTFLAVMLFTVLIQRFGSNKTFYIMISSFMIFYAVFGFILYPNREAILMSSEAITKVQDVLPSFLKILDPVIACLGNWPFVLFDVISEIWGIMAVASLFWQFANKITMQHEIKRFFAMYSVVGNIGVFSAGATLSSLQKVNPAIPEQEANRIFDINVMILMGGVVAVCLIIMGIYFGINKFVLTDPKLYVPDQVKPEKKKEKVKFTEGMKIMFKSPSLMLLFVIIISVGMTLVLTELSWEAQLIDYCKGFADRDLRYSRIKGYMSMAISIVTTVFVFISTNLLMRCKWRTCASFPAFIYLIFGVPFFALILYSRFTGKESIIGVDILIATVLLGSVVVCLSKSVKYSIADTTRNMVYTQLGDEEQTKGQASVEVIGGRLGKACGAGIQQVLTTIVKAGSNLVDHAPVVVGVFLFTLGAWLTSVFKLSPRYEKAVKENARHKEIDHE